MVRPSFAAFCASRCGCEDSLRCRASLATDSAVITCRQCSMQISIIPDERSASSCTSCSWYCQGQQHAIRGLVKHFSAMQPQEIWPERRSSSVKPQSGRVNGLESNRSAMTHMHNLLVAPLRCAPQLSQSGFCLSVYAVGDRAACHWGGLCTNNC